MFLGTGPGNSGGRKGQHALRILIRLEGHESSACASNKCHHGKDLLLLSDQYDIRWPPEICKIGI